jgi:hypothetical protein
MLLITSNDSHRDSTCVDNKRCPEKTERSIKNKNQQTPLTLDTIHKIQIMKTTKRSSIPPISTKRILTELTEQKHDI